MARPVRPNTNPLSRGGNTLNGSALQRDLDAARDQTPIGVSAGIAVINGATRVTGIHTLLVTGAGATVSFENGVATVDISGGAAPTTGYLYQYIPFLGMNAAATEFTDLWAVHAYLEDWTDWRLQICQNNSDGGDYLAEYWDGAAWQALGLLVPTMTTGGTTTLPYLSAWQAIDAGAKDPAGVGIKVSHAGDTANTDVGNLTLHLRRTGTL